MAFSIGGLFKTLGDFVTNPIGTVVGGVGDLLGIGGQGRSSTPVPRNAPRPSGGPRGSTPAPTVSRYSSPRPSDSPSRGPAKVIGRTYGGWRFVGWTNPKANWENIRYEIFQQGQGPRQFRSPNGTVVPAYMATNRSRPQLRVAQPAPEPLPQYMVGPGVTRSVPQKVMHRPTPRPSETPMANTAAVRKLARKAATVTPTSTAAPRRPLSQVAFQGTPVLHEEAGTVVDHLHGLRDEFNRFIDGGSGTMAENGALDMAGMDLSEMCKMPARVCMDTRTRRMYVPRRRRRKAFFTPSQLQQLFALKAGLGPSDFKTMVGPLVLSHRGR